MIKNTINLQSESANVERGSKRQGEWTKGTVLTMISSEGRVVRKVVEMNDAAKTPENVEAVPGSSSIPPMANSASENINAIFAPHGGNSDSQENHSDDKLAPKQQKEIPSPLKQHHYDKETLQKFMKSKREKIKKELISEKEKEKTEKMKREANLKALADQVASQRKAKQIATESSNGQVKENPFAPPVANKPNIQLNNFFVNKPSSALEGQFVNPHQILQNITNRDKQRDESEDSVTSPSSSFPTSRLLNSVSDSTNISLSLNPSIDQCKSKNKNIGSSEPNTYRENISTQDSYSEDNSDKAERLKRLGMMAKKLNNQIRRSENFSGSSSATASSSTELRGMTSRSESVNTSNPSTLPSFGQISALNSSDTSKGLLPLTDDELERFRSLVGVEKVWKRSDKVTATPSSSEYQTSSSNKSDKKDRAELMTTAYEKNERDSIEAIMARMRLKASNTRAHSQIQSSAAISIPQKPPRTETNKLTPEEMARFEYLVSTENSWKDIVVSSAPKFQTNYINSQRPSETKRRTTNKHDSVDESHYSLKGVTQTKKGTSVTRGPSQNSSIKFFTKVDDNDHLHLHQKSRDNFEPQTKKSNVKSSKILLDNIPITIKNPFYINIHGPMSLNHRLSIYKAAVKIQTIYRGYKVRKVTCHILKKNVYPLQAMSLKLTSKSKPNQIPVPPSYFQDTGDSTGETDDDLFRKRNKLLQMERIKPFHEKKYRVTNLKVPHNIRPIVEFLENGNVDDFIDSRGKELEWERMKKTKTLASNSVITKELDVSDKGIQTSEGLKKISKSQFVNKKRTEEKDIQCSLTSSNDLRLMPTRKENRDSNPQLKDYSTKSSVSLMANEIGFGIRVPHRNSVSRIRHSKDTSMSQDYATINNTGSVRSHNQSDSNYASSKRGRTSQSIPGLDDTENDQVSELISEVVDAPPSHYDSLYPIKNILVNNKDPPRTKNAPPINIKVLPTKQNVPYLTKNLAQSKKIRSPNKESLPTRLEISSSSHDSESDSSKNFVRIHPKTAYGMAPSELRRRFDAEIERQDAVNMAIDHLNDLEKQREIEEWKEKKQRLEREKELERQRAEILKKDLEIQMKEDQNKLKEQETMKKRKNSDETIRKQRNEFERKVNSEKKEIEKKALEAKREIEINLRDEAWQLEHRRSMEYFQQQTKLNFEKLSHDISSKIMPGIGITNPVNINSEAIAAATSAAIESTTNAWQRLQPINSLKNQKESTIQSSDENSDTLVSGGQSNDYTSSFVTSSFSASTTSNSEPSHSHSPSILPSSQYDDRKENTESNNYDSNSFVSESSQVVSSRNKSQSPYSNESFQTDGNQTFISEALDIESSNASEIKTLVSVESSIAEDLSASSVSECISSQPMVLGGGQGFPARDLIPDDEQATVKLATGPFSSYQSDLVLFSPMKMTQAISNPISSLTAENITSNLANRVQQDITSYSYMLDSTLSSLGEYLKDPHQTSNSSFNDIHPTIDNLDASSNSLKLLNLTMDQKDKPALPSNSCLDSALTLLQTLQQEEDFKCQHQKNMLKLQLRAIMDESKHKLSLLQYESPSSVRKKKQRAIALSLREQWLNIKKVMEALEQTSLKNKEMLAQHHQILANSAMERASRSHTSMSASPTLTKQLDESTSNEDLSVREMLKAFSEEEAPSSRYLRKPRVKESLSSPTKVKTKRVRKEESTATDSSGGFAVSSSEKDEEVYGGQLSVRGKKLEPPLKATDSQIIISVPSSDSTNTDTQISMNSTHSQTEEKSTKISTSSQCKDALPGSSDEKSSDVESSKSRKSDGILKGFSVPIRVSLSPRVPRKSLNTSQQGLNDSLMSLGMMRYSSESDDSFSLSQNETSETSDGEGKLLALQEQLTFRKQEAEKLKRERRRVRREKIASKEVALKKQIAIYDSFIENARQDLEKELLESQKMSNSVRPVIKRPENRKNKELSIILSPDKSDSSELSSISTSRQSTKTSSDSSTLSSKIVDVNKNSNVEHAIEDVVKATDTKETESQSSHDSTVKNDDTSDLTQYTMSEGSASIVEEICDELSQQSDERDVSNSVSVSKPSDELKDSYSSGSFESSTTSEKEQPSESSEEVSKTLSSNTLVEAKEDTSSIEEDIAEEIVEENEEEEEPVQFLDQTTQAKELPVKLPDEMFLESSLVEEVDVTKDVIWQNENEENDRESEEMLLSHSLSEEDLKTDETKSDEPEKSKFQIMQKKVENISQSILSSIVQETSNIFTDIVDKKNSGRQDLQLNLSDDLFNNSTIKTLIRELSDEGLEDGPTEGKGLMRDPSAPPDYPCEDLNSSLDPDELSNKLLALLNSDEMERLDSELESLCGDLQNPCHPTLVVTTPSTLTDEITDELEIQQLQLQFPGLVIRAVPDHPPPPYTPPPSAPRSYSPPQEETDDLSIQETSSHDGCDTPMPPEEKEGRRLSKADIQQIGMQSLYYVPKNQEEMDATLIKCLDVLCNAWFTNGLNPECVEMPHFEIEFEQDSDLAVNSVKSFNELVFSTVKELVCEQFQQYNQGALAEKARTRKPWSKSNETLFIRKHPTETELRANITKQVRVMMRWEVPFSRESRMLQWAQKSRDPVDFVLIRELGTEEKFWTDFEEDEEGVKVKLASGLLQTLISDTVHLFKNIIKKKVSCMVLT